ncbi:manganese transporter [Sphingomonas sp. Leaf407]|uniref:manganese-binding transcriptional regulator MntR n=1 Tax=unclassified Sphingomonas TaxID=196159 RepID=UPI0006F2516D|nr:MULTISPECIES: manganese-binding transcriptional regulator MntR [unclassified Sphingomonas]KQN36436.1 manganese transporter [Sphingomonas sp. Leaf42]KQT27056.1 manganese transporter [Sphingomonas sp. Leaf407]
MTDDAQRRAAAFRATREAHATEMAEDYVELIGDLMTQFGEARLIDLAAHMGVSQPTAAKIVQRLKILGLVENRPYRALFLTGEGEALAARSRARHHVVSDFLLALGIDPETVAIDSEGMEHHVSDTTLAAMRRFVADRNGPTT